MNLVVISIMMTSQLHVLDVTNKSFKDHLTQLHGELLLEEDGALTIAKDSTRETMYV
jgi:hypothetical protein